MLKHNLRLFSRERGKRGNPFFPEHHRLSIRGLSDEDWRGGHGARAEVNRGQTLIILTLVLARGGRSPASSARNCCDPILLRGRAVANAGRQAFILRRRRQAYPATLNAPTPRRTSVEGSGTDDEMLMLTGSPATQK